MVLELNKNFNFYKINNNTQVGLKNNGPALSSAIKSGGGKDTFTLRSTTALGFSSTRQISFTSNPKYRFDNTTRQLTINIEGKGEAHLQWGINGWKKPGSELLPEGTKIEKLGDAQVPRSPMINTAKGEQVITIPDADKIDSLQYVVYYPQGGYHHEGGYDKSANNQFYNVNIQELKKQAVTSYEPVNKDFANIQRGSRYNQQTGSLDFGVFSTADNVDLCFFKKTHGEKEVIRIPMIKDEKRPGMWVHSVSQEGIKDLLGIDLSNPEHEPVYYGYRADGRAEWLDYQKLLIDDHALATSHDLVTKEINENGSIYADKITDTAKIAPKSIFSRKLTEISKPVEQKENLKPITDHVIYEAHIMGLTKGLGEILTREDKIKLASAKKGNQSIIEKLQLLTPEKIKQAEKEKLANELNKKPKEITEQDLKTKRESLAKANLKRLYKDTPEMLKKADEWKDEYAGTYKGATFMIPYLKNMGITMIEFMPIMEFENDGNSWGYMTQHFMSPDRDYAFDKKSAEGATKEFKEMVKTFNDAGIEVCMDVVYNHTGEGGLHDEKPGIATKVSLRGLADDEYFLREKNDPTRYHNASGCGADTNAKSPAYQELVVNSLKHFKNLGVSAFRFDLAPFLGNSNENGDGNKGNGITFNPEHELLKDIESLGLRPANKDGKGLMLIAEPWGGQTVQGGFPKNWNEWNGLHFRDVIRKSINSFRKKDNRPSAGNIIRAMCGSKEYINGGPSPRSINFVTAHDGFTLYDLFAYNQKHNFNDPTSGESNNHSWNQYWEDNADDINNKDTENVPYPFSRRENAVKTALSLLAASAGTPMILSGDERFHTKYGNNNSYNWNAGNVIDWRKIVDNSDEKGNLQKLNADNLAEFTKRIINFRHNHKALHPDRYYEEKDKNNYNGKEISFYDKFGTSISELNDDKRKKFAQDNDSWSDVIGIRLDETEFHSKKEDVKHPTLYIAYNRSKEPIEIKLPPHKISNKQWYVAVNTSIPLTDPEDMTKSFKELTEKPAYKDGEEKLLEDQRSLYLSERSMAILVEK